MTTMISGWFSSTNPPLRLSRPKGRVCFWNYSDGDCVQKTQSLIQSLHEHDVQHDFFCYMDSEEVTEATKIFIKSVSMKAQARGLHKIGLVTELAHEINYDYLVWLDYKFRCIGPMPYDPIKLCDRSPVHVFLDKDITVDPEGTWGDFSNRQVVQLFRRNGVTTPTIYSCNSDIWVMQRVFVSTFSDLANQFIDNCRASGVEPNADLVLSYVTHLISTDVDSHRLKHFRHDWLKEPVEEPVEEPVTTE